jgi:ribosomal protein L11 methyltransferase
MNRAKWIELSVTTTPEFVEPVSELFRRYGDREVIVQEEGDWDPDNDHDVDKIPHTVVVMTCIPIDATADSRREMIDVGVRLISYLEPGIYLKHKVVSEEEWENSWKAQFTVYRIGERLIIKPTWHNYDPAPHDIVIELDPGMAFGTGHHPTTKLCLEQIERWMVPGMRVLDLGTGSGILAIAASKLGAQCITGLDTDGIAIEVASANAAQNNVENFNLLHGTIPAVKLPKKSFDLALANVTANVIISSVEPLAEILKTQGLLIASGILSERQLEVEDHIGKRFLVKESFADGEWLTILATKK